MSSIQPQRALETPLPVVWVWGFGIVHHTVGFGAVCFFGLGCFSVVVWVWEEGLHHKVYMVSMLGVVGVVVGVC